MEPEALKIKIKIQCEHRVKLVESTHGYAHGHIDLN